MKGQRTELPWPDVAGAAAGDEPPLIGLTLQRRPGQHRAAAVVQNVAYYDAIVRAGGRPVGIPVGAEEATTDAFFASCDGLVLPGGLDVDPARYGATVVAGCDVKTVPPNDALELSLAAGAAAADLPVLGICRGMQIMNVSFGGTLWQDLRIEAATTLPHAEATRPQSALAHRVRVEPASLLASLVVCRKLLVNSNHHQGIRRLAPGLVAAAWSEDGIVEAIERPGSSFFVGVQWHPEDLVGIGHAEALFVGLVRSAAARRAEGGHHRQTTA